MAVPPREPPSILVEFYCSYSYLHRKWVFSRSLADRVLCVVGRLSVQLSHSRSVLQLPNQRSPSPRLISPTALPLISLPLLVLRTSSAFLFLYLPPLLQPFLYLHSPSLPVPPISTTPVPTQLLPIISINTHFKMPVRKSDIVCGALLIQDLSS